MWGSIGRRSGAAVVVVVLVAVAAGCGKGGPTRSATRKPKPSGQGEVFGSSTSSPSTSPTASSGDRAADEALARRAVLTAADLPAGWTGKPHESTTDQQLDRQLADCLHADVALINTDAQPHADSDDFTTADGRQQLYNGVAVFASLERARSFLDAIDAPGAPDCVVTAMRDALERDRKADSPSIANVTAARLDLGALGDRVVAYRVTAGIGGVDVAVYADLAFVARGRAIAFLATVGALTPVSIDSSRGLLEKVVGRLPA